MVLLGFYAKVFTKFYQELVNFQAIKNYFSEEMWECENAVSKKCEYGILEITSETKISRHKSKTSDLIRLLYHNVRK